MKVYIQTSPELMQMLHRIDYHLVLIGQQLGAVIEQGEQEMADLSALAGEIAENTDAVNSASALLTQLSNELRANATDPAAIQALADQLDANNQALSDAVAANTPAAPGETPVEPTG